MPKSNAIFARKFEFVSLVLPVVRGGSAHTSLRSIETEELAIEDLVANNQHGASFDLFFLHRENFVSHAQHRSEHALQRLTWGMFEGTSDKGKRGVST